MYSEKNISPKIKKLLSLTGKKISDLADSTGIARNTASNWTNKMLTPRIESIVPIAEFFDVPLEYLFSESILESPADIPFLHSSSKEKSHLKEKSQEKCSPEHSKQDIVNIDEIEIYHTTKKILDEKTTELIEIFFRLEPLGKYRLLAEAYFQLKQQNEFIAESAVSKKSEE